MEGLPPDRFQSLKLAAAYHKSTEKCPISYTIYLLAGSAAFLENQQNLSLAGGRGGCSFDADLVRNLCKEIIDETDPDRAPICCHCCMR
jgi:hypothetical protein